jgi:hypothetical protein
LIDVDLPDHEGLAGDLDADRDDTIDPPLLSLSSSDEALQTLRKELTQIRDLLSEPH